MRTLVYSKEEIEKIRPYKKNYNLSIFPKHFPAFVDFIDHDGGYVEIIIRWKFLKFHQSIIRPLLLVRHLRME
jgi:hypothetical protein